MAATYNLISSQVLGSSAASVTFSSIPQTYTDLVLKVSSATNDGYFYDQFHIVFNSNTSAVYSDTWMNNNGSSGGGSSNATGNSYNYVFAGIAGGTATANTFGSTEIYIPSYTSSQQKPFSSFFVTENNSASLYQVGAAADLFQSTAAITSIALTPKYGSFIQYSSFYLYGIRNS
jgi:hypothetical protein